MYCSTIFRSCGCRRIVGVGRFLWVSSAGCCEYNLIQNRGVSFSLAVAAAAVAVCAPSATGSLSTPGPGRTSRCRRASSIRVRQKKKSTARLSPRRRRCHQDCQLQCDPSNRWNGRDHLKLDSPQKGVCVVSGHGYDVSNIKWGGHETFVEVLFELSATSTTFLAATGLRLRRGLICADDVRLDFQTLDRGRCSPSQLSSDGRRPSGGLEYPIG